MASVFGLAIGSNGTTLLSVEPYHRPKLSVNTGTSWTDVAYFSGSEALTGCAVGLDNQTMLIADPDTGVLYMSLNGSVDWSVVPGPIAGGWPGICGVGIADDCQAMVACCYGGRCYITNNRWADYSEILPKGDVDADWRCIAIGGDGLVILVGETGGRLYLSQDGGETDNWPETRPAGDFDVAWDAVAVGTDNKLLMAGDNFNYGTLYRSIDVGDNWFTEEVDPLYISITAVALGGAALHSAVACDAGSGNSHVFVGAYTAPLPPVPPGPTPPPVYPVVDRLRIEAYHSALEVSEVEILGLPMESDFIDINS